MRTIFIYQSKLVKMLQIQKITPLIENEKELIRLIRLFHEAFPNGQNDIEWLVEKQVQKLLDRN